MSWDPLDVPSMVYNYEVGVASASGSLAPDLMSFQSTKQFAHHRMMHGNIPDGTRFYIIIKTISKSNVEGITVRISNIVCMVFVLVFFINLNQW